MGVKNRILALKLIEKLDKKPEFKEEIKVANHRIDDLESNH